MFERLKEMDRRTIVMFVLAGVVGLLLFSTVAGAIRQAGWNEGFLVGLLSNGDENAKAMTPYLAYRGGFHGGYGLHGWGWHPFGFIGGFFRFLFFGFLLVMLLKFLGFLRWRMHGGYSSGDFRSHPWHHHRHHGPWDRHGGQFYGQHPGQPQAAPGGQPAPNPSQPEETTPQPTSWVKV